jgi:CopG family transcriptional regulator, nickel-responsive regulator
MRRMQRFTISLDDELAAQFDALISARGYGNRSEAVRDLIRERLGATTLAGGAARWCVAAVSYVYDHHDQPVAGRVMDLQHDHHDLVVASLHAHLDHDHCLESVVLRGPTDPVRQCAEQLVALRGVRHGQVHLVPLQEQSRPHRHGAAAHRHHKPIA